MWDDTSDFPVLQRGERCCWQWNRAALEDEALEGQEPGS